MVEKSIFINDNELRNWINDVYDLGIDKVEKTELGSANCYYLYSNSNERYFLKEFQEKITYENLEEEIKICKYLNENGIGTVKHYPIPIHKQEAYRNSKISKESYEISEHISDTILSIPMYYGISEEQIEYVIDMLNRFDA